MWRNIHNSDVKNITSIFPLKQKTVIKIVELAQQCPGISRIIIFGSSITAACNPWSDVDVYIERDTNETTPLGTFSDALDIWYNDSVSPAEDLYENIMKGVVVYERDPA